MEIPAHRLRHIEWAANGPVHSLPVRDRVGAPRRVFASALRPSTRWAPRGPTDAHAISRPSSSRCRREVPCPDSFAALMLPLTTDRAALFQGATVSLQYQCHEPVVKGKTAASHRAERRPLPLPQASCGYVPRYRVNWLARSRPSECLHETTGDPTSDYAIALCPEPPGNSGHAR